MWRGVHKKFFTLARVNPLKNPVSNSINRNTKQLVHIRYWVAFLGIFLAEGSTSYDKKSGSYKVVISQSNSASPRKYRRIAALLKNLPFRFHKFPTGFICHSKQLYTYLEQFGKSYQKFIPKEIKELPPRLLNILVDWMIVGDGTCYTGKNRKRVCVYYTVSRKLKDDFEESKILDLKNNLTADSKVTSVVYISKEEAFKIFTTINKDQPILLQSVTKNILPASLEIKTNNLADMTPLADTLSKNAGVEEVKFFKDVIDKFRFWSNLVYGISGFLAFVFIIIAFVVIVVSLRITISLKKTELEIMKLVGAADRYVRSPLLLQGVLFGVTSALITSLLFILITIILLITHVASPSFTFSLIFGIQVSLVLYIVILVAFMLVSGFLLGYFGSSFAVKKYLKY